MKRTTVVQRTSRDVARLIPAPWNLLEFIANVARQRGRPINIVEFDFDAESKISGAWRSGDNEDTILVPATTSGLRREAIVAHEVAHMMLGHSPAELGFLGEDAVADVMPMMLVADSDLARKFLFRHAYDKVAEADAEQLATLIISAITAAPANLTARHVTNSLL